MKQNSTFAVDYITSQWFSTHFRGYVNNSHIMNSIDKVI